MNYPQNLLLRRRFEVKVRSADARGAGASLAAPALKSRLEGRLLLRGDLAAGALAARALDLDAPRLLYRRSTLNRNLQDAILVAGVDLALV